MDAVYWFATGTVMGYFLRPLIDVFCKIVRNAWLAHTGRSVKPPQEK